MRIALFVLIAGTLLSGFAAAYATSTQRLSRTSISADADAPATPVVAPVRAGLASK